MTSAVHTLSKAAVIVVFFLLPFATVHAHGGGLAFTSTSTNEHGTYFVDVDYEDSALVAGRVGRFTFRLYTDVDRTAEAPFTHVFVRIEKKFVDGKTEQIFLGTLAHGVSMSAGVSLLLPEDGSYAMFLRYTDDTRGEYGETLAETTFDLEVLPRRDDTMFAYMSYEFLGGLTVGAIIGMSLLYIVFRRGFQIQV